MSDRLNNPVELRLTLFANGVPILLPSPKTSNSGYSAGWERASTFPDSANAFTGIRWFVVLEKWLQQRKDLPAHQRPFHRPDTRTTVGPKQPSTRVQAWLTPLPSTLQADGRAWATGRGTAGSATDCALPSPYFP